MVVWARFVRVLSAGFEGGEKERVKLGSGVSGKDEEKESKEDKRKKKNKRKREEKRREREREE